jgi:hypothetical protein
MKILWAVLLAVWVVLMVLVNIWDTRRRKKLRAKQRQQEDEELSFDQSVW